MSSLLVLLFSEKYTIVRFGHQKTILTISAATSQTAICAEIEAESGVHLVQVLGEYNLSAPEEYWDQVYTRFCLDLSADPGT